MGENCDKLGILVYEDLGCNPEYNNSNAQCPVKYSCKNLKPTNKSCYFQGKNYNHSETVEQNLSLASCNVGCFCQSDGPTSSFECGILDCPEWMGTVRLGPGCYRKYSLKECCSTGRVCPPLDNVEKCVVDGVEYNEGEKFYPKDTCSVCVCKKGFEGKFEEPFCRRINCGQQLKRGFGTSIQQACAPLYFQHRHEDVYCCPDDWVCPTGYEVIEGEANSDETCKYGNTTLKVGQYFQRNNKISFTRRFEKVKCECVIPPLMQCVGA